MGLNTHIKQELLFADVNFETALSNTLQKLLESFETSFVFELELHIPKETNYPIQNDKYKFINTK